MYLFFSFWRFEPSISYYTSPSDGKCCGRHKSISHIKLSRYEHGRYVIHQDIKRNACNEYNNEFYNFNRHNKGSPIYCNY